MPCGPSPSPRTHPRDEWGELPPQAGLDRRRPARHPADAKATSHSHPGITYEEHRDRVAYSLNNHRSNNSLLPQIFGLGPGQSLFEPALAKVVAKQASPYGYRVFD